MHAWTIIGWTLDGECYCDGCEPAHEPNGRPGGCDEPAPIFAGDEVPDGWTCGGCGFVLVAGEWLSHEDAVARTWTRCVECNGQQPTTVWHDVGDPCQSCGGRTINADPNAVPDDDDEATEDEA